MRVVNSTPRPLHHPDGPHSQSGHSGDERNRLPLPGLEPEPSSPSPKLSVIPTTLSWLNSSLECHETTAHFMEPEASSPLSQNPPLSASYARSIQSTIQSYFLNTHLMIDKFFGSCPAHPNPLIRSTGNYSLADFHRQYKKYIHKRPKHILL